MVDKIYRKSSIIMRDKYGWKLHQNDNIKVWFCGYQYNKSIKDTINKIHLVLNNSSTDKNDILNWIKGLSGHFSIVIETNEWTIAAVDKICSIPLFFINNGDILISNYAPSLKTKCKLDNNDLDEWAGLEIAMSGYTIGSKTLYSSIDRLEGGEYLLLHKGSLFKDFHYTYSPWKTKNRSESQLKKEFTDVCINMLTDLKNDSNGRQIVIPLSAGNDSRLIASGLNKLGVKNVICFSYGRKGNFETPISKEIAKKLGYKWLYIPVNIKGKYNFFKSDVYQRYVAEFESYGSVPNIQEIYEISLLKQNPLVDDNAIIVNGNSGDFISGGHVNTISNTKCASENTSRLNWSLFLDKHYSSWRDLRTQENDSNIVSELNKALTSRSIECVDFEKYHYAIMETSECIGRQSRYVTGQQRTYEFFGYEWRLPLWSDEMVKFWESVPHEYKVDQKLYIKTLRENNWGDVWLDIKVNDKKINPYFLRWARIFFKMLFIPIGKSKWHRFEKNVFEYFIHPSNSLTVMPYLKILFDQRGYRNANSWLSYKMIKNIGFGSCLWKKNNTILGKEK